MEKKTLFLPIVLISLLVAIFLLLSSFSTKENARQTTEQNQFQNNPNEIEDFALIQDLRKTYGFSNAVFENLPKPPKDFQKITASMHNGQFTNYAFFPKEYFLQPEFFEEFKENGFSYWLNPSPTHYVAKGFGVYPTVQEIELKSGQTVTASFFVRSAWGVQSNQGAKIDLNNLNEKINAQILEPEFFIGYSFPKFSKNWVKKIDVKISANHNLESSTHELNFSFSNASDKKIKEWSTLENRTFYELEQVSESLNPKIIVKII